MMTFFKFQGAGNDFILIEDFEKSFPYSLVPKLCDRRLGIGADGLILAARSNVADFEMIFFNSDGSRPGFCGNGLRCFVHFLRELGYEKPVYKIAFDERILTVKWEDSKIYTYLPKPRNLFWELPILSYTGYGIEVGVPHIVVFSKSEIDVIEEGKRLRHHELAGPEGANANFVSKINEGQYQIRTYERGIEGETLSCGSGAAAAAYVIHQLGMCQGQVELLTRSGEIFKIDIGEEIGILGPSEKVFEGKFSLRNF